ncbi:MAG: ABC transporter permease [Bacteroidota bacterium]
MRNIRREKVFFFINLIGLSAGLACALLIYLWVVDELAVDKFHEQDSQLYEAMLTIKNNENIVTQHFVPGPLAKAMLDEMPEVERVVEYTHTFRNEKNILAVGDKKVKAKGDYVGADFFNVFSFDLMHGDKSKVLADKKSIVLSESLAKKMFNTTDNLVGKSIKMDNDQSFLISGVYKDFPRESSINFDFLLPFELFRDNNQWLLNWLGNAPGVSVILKKGTDVKKFNQKIASFVRTKSKDLHNFTLFVRPFSDAYLYGNYENGVQSGGRIEYVKLFGLIAIFILLIACINFMNLSTAKASRRIKEIGVKKAVGADRSILVAQYLGESVIMAFLSLIIAVVIIYFFLPTFNVITGKELALSFDPQLILSILGITLLTGLLSGSYPALYLSGFNPATVLKGKFKSSVSELLVRKVLVVFQFSLSVMLIVAVMVVYNQIEYIQSRNLGYDKDNLIYFDREGWSAKSLETFLAKLESEPGIRSTSSMVGNFLGSKTTTDQIEWQNKSPDDKTVFIFQIINYGLFKTLGIDLSSGRAFSKDYGAEDSKIVFNETAIKAMGLQGEPVGQRIRWGESEFEIAGVVKDFQLESVKEEIKPMLFLLNPEASNKIFAKIEKGKELETVRRLEGFYRQYNPGYPFDFKFLDEDYQALYSSETRISTLSRYFAGIAIIISCLGLFGLAAFSAERRTKEIGIRKALSASKFSIVFLLSKDFTKVVLLAIVIALPLSYLITKRWLDDFVYRIDLKLWYFLLSGFLALVIAWLTVGIQGLKAANKNPVDCLKAND